MARHALRTQAQRHPRRRDGPRQDHTDNRATCPSRLRARHLGAASDRRADERDAQLGDGVQEVVSRVQDTHVLRQPEGAQVEAAGRRGCVSSSHSAPFVSS